jgi:hypothetical protein
MAVTIDNEGHYALTYRYLQVLGAELRAALQVNGVRDPDQQWKILKTFLFDLAMSWDDGCIKDSDSRPGHWYPTPCFRDDLDATRAATFVIPDGQDSFHELAVFSVLDDLFAMNDPERDWKFQYNETPGSDLFEERSSES